MNKRNYIVDYLKCLAIVLVVLGHVIDFSGLLRVSVIGKIIYSLHVPLFFLLAGVLCHRQNIKIFYKKKFMRILVPFYTFTVLKLLYSNFILKDFSHGNGYFQIYEAFIVGGLYWFPYALFLCFCVVPLFWLIQNNKKRRIIIVCSFIVVLVLNLIFNFFHVKLPSVFQLNKAFFHLIFFLAGLCLQELSGSIKTKLEKHRLVILMSVLCYVIFYCYYFVQEKELTYLLTILFSFSLIYIVYEAGNMFRFILQDNRIVQIIGTYSLQIMFFDSFYKVILFKVFSLFSTVNWGIVGLIVILDILMSCLSCIIIKKIPYVRFFFGV